MVRPVGWLDGCRQRWQSGMMNQHLVGYARVSTEQQDLTAQRNSLAALGVGNDRIYVDHGLTGKPGPSRTPTRSRRLPRRRHVGGDQAGPVGPLTSRRPRHPRRADPAQRRLSLGGSIHDPTDPVGRLLFNVLAMVAEFEADLVRLRTREGMQVARAKGRLWGKQPKLKAGQAKHVGKLFANGNYSTLELAELFNVSRSTIYRTIRRMRVLPADPHRPFR